MDIRIVLPDAACVPENRSSAPLSVWPVVYVLPVEAGTTTQWGDPLTEVLQHDLHNRHGVICVFPAFAALPWYADHPDDDTLHQESWLLQDVIPYVEKHCPARRDRAGRLLAGFSKSGWGAWSLLLRHPDRFERAAAFDAPLMMTTRGKYGSGPIFGSDDNFQSYCLTRLLQQRAQELHDRPRRLMLSGQGNFQSDHLRMHALLDELRIPHTWIPGTPRDHSWHSGWLAEAFAWLTTPQK